MFLNYKIQGEGKTVLLIHGLFGSLDNLRGLANELAKNHRVFQIDLPNHGLSPHSDNVDYAFQANAVKEFIVQHQLKNITVIGHSMGGKVAMLLAIKNPTLVAQLIVLDIAPVCYPSGAHDAIFSALNSCLNIGLSSRKEVNTKLAELIFDDGVRQFLLKSFAKQDDGTLTWRFNLLALEKNYADIIDWPTDELFEGKTLFMKGSHSNYISSEYQQKIEQQFPNSTQYIVANAGHWLHAEKPHIVAQVILDFLAP